MTRNTVRLLLCGLILAGPAVPASAEPVEFRATFTKAFSPTPVTGRLVLLLDANLFGPEPRESAGLIFDVQPFCSVTVKDWKPDTPLVIGDRATCFLSRPSELPSRRYVVQAVLDTDTTTWSFAMAPGNGYSDPLIVSIDPRRGASVDLAITHRVEAPRFEETKFIREVDVEGRLLSDFYGRPIRMKAAVILPPSYFEHSTARYPAVYDIPGWGGTHYDAASNSRRYRKNPDGLDRVLVVLNPDGPLGHHTFTDSASNGPRGKALIAELIPYIEREYRVIAEPSARLLVGQSSGAWASLWLQIAYPDFFGGAWVTAPDPVDFRSFIGDTDIYQPNANVFFDANRRPRTLAVARGQQALSVKEFSDMERVLGDGGQLGAWESVFSRRAADGSPERLFDRTTGLVNQAVAESWRRYDLRLMLESGWPTLAPCLAGKLHVYVGKEDTFLLDRPARLLADSMARLKSDAVIELVDGNHFTVADNGALRTRINDDMDKMLVQAYPELARPRRTNAGDNAGMPAQDAQRPATTPALPIGGAGLVACGGTMRHRAP